MLQPYYNPLILMVGLFIFLFNPTNFYHRDGRYWMIGVLGKIILAPFFHVGFADFWLADQVVQISRIVFLLSGIMVGV